MNRIMFNNRQWGLKGQIGILQSDLALDLGSTLLSCLTLG